MRFQQRHFLTTECMQYYDSFFRIFTDQFLTKSTFMAFYVWNASKFSTNNIHSGYLDSVLWGRNNLHIINVYKFLTNVAKTYIFRQESI